MNGSRWILAGLLLASSVTQAQNLPSEISGRWTLAARDASQTFSLENIQKKEDGSFAADLTWWTLDRRCAIRATPITGKVTETGLSFDATTKCNVSFAVELHRAEKGWEGKGTTRGANEVVVHLKAN